ncbi:UDP-N-acetylmuramoyl-tripeptide--D-alanyl-D-alanine ligase [Marinobacterium weihaiense]|uniref:UDP-N-acetylmuramoyl-tripeptide--D-alanyl-D-alanine ligase n=1 Tax=Marinobacterium weihaiense TaxID=2851016 RepID=A0ABS6M8T6_9GAMM|nr:UDP-N-acetylmuramoyl-tripeptide--D-alanyl-D-alanine ligase [Marinobacterium weihaiense]MBV0932692.1 UDP-N-acetylmuramoyl-tripeptide--D-alanyl-D-alanine ligase [Marinobacterium weihaiense]
MMRAFELNELQPVLGAQQRGENCTIERVVTDSRQLAPGDLFVALKGPSFDGHDFVGAAELKGAAAVVVDHEVETRLPQLVVADTLQALGQLGGYNRSLFQAPVFAVTGSGGKTTVKEMLAGLLAVKGDVLATTGNLNNEIGAPLTLLRLAPEHRSAVVELGASAQGEIARTVAMTRPDVALLNNAMGAHLEGFGGLEGVVRAKGEIFGGLREGGVGVVNLDSPHASVWIERLHRLKRRVFTFGVENGAADISASRLEMNADGSWRFVLDDGTDQLPVCLQVLGRHNVANATAAAAAWVAAGQPLTQIAGVLDRFTPVAGRLSPHPLASGALLIDDSYNANADAIKAATELLAQLPGERLLVLGDMAELGAESLRLHAEVGHYAAERGIERLLVVGPQMQAAVDAFTQHRPGAEHFKDQALLLERLNTLLAPETTLLVKGSRSAQMDRVVAALLKGEH